MSVQRAIFTMCWHRSDLGDTVDQTINEHEQHRAYIPAGDENRGQTGKSGRSSRLAGHSGEETYSRKGG